MLQKTKQWLDDIQTWCQFGCKYSFKDTFTQLICKYVNNKFQWYKSMYLYPTEWFQPLCWQILFPDVSNAIFNLYSFVCVFVIRWCCTYFFIFCFVVNNSEHVSYVQWKIFQYFTYGLHCYNDFFVFGLYFSFDITSLLHKNIFFFI